MCKEKITHQPLSVEMPVGPSTQVWPLYLHSLLARNLIQSYLKFKLIFKSYHNTCVISPDSFFRCVLFKHLHLRYLMMLLLLLRSSFSCVRLCATPQTAAHQAPPSLGFSRQEHWSGLPFPSPRHEGEVAQSCPTPSNTMDCSLPGSSVHGVCQAHSKWEEERITVNGKKTGAKSEQTHTI